MPNVMAHDSKGLWVRRIAGARVKTVVPSRLPIYLCID